MSRSIFAPDARLTPYTWEAAPRPTLPPVSLDGAVDVAVVGSGYTGLSAALTLARAGRSVLVLEAGAAGEGASSRSQGQLGAVLKRSVTQLTGRFGWDAARELLRAGMAAVEYTKALIAREQIRCQLSECGRLVAAYRPRDYERLARETELLGRAIGYEADMVPRAEQHREIGSDFYYGGQVRHQDATLHAGLYHQGLLERALAAGVRLADRTPVLGVERAGAALVCRTARGPVRAGQVLAATNGYTGAATPWLRRRVLPIGAYIIATEPIDAAQLKALIPRARACNDTRRLLYGFRPAPDGSRLLFGGRASLTETDPAKTAPRLHATMSQVFPALAEVRVSHAWTGYSAFTFEHLPHIGSHDGVHYALGYCGSGIGLGTWMGHKAALRILGDADAGTAFDDLPFTSRGPYAGHPWALAGALAWYRFLDRLPRP